MFSESKPIFPVELPEFISHKIKKREGEEEISARMFEYLMAGNGVFVRAGRKEFSVSLALCEIPIKNLPAQKNEIIWHKPPINSRIWAQILEDARRQNDHGNFKEDVYVVFWSEARYSWEWRRVSRERTAASTIADDTLDEYKRACIEIHTHPEGVIHFSRADDRDESGKFRIFGILVDACSSAPKVRFRCGVYEHFVEIPASFVGGMPEGVTDLNRADLVISKNLKR